jgi:RHS repeat-associated protein
VRALTDESGNVVDTGAYEAFGTKNVEAGSDPLAYGFAGEPFESTSKLAYHRARWMDARVGRFVGMDPFEGIDKAPETLHKYVYVENEPSDLTDDTGLASPIDLIVGNAVHKAISSYWIDGVQSTTLNDRVANRSISSLIDFSFSRATNWFLKFNYGLSALARPDLAARREHKIYEIKSEDDKSAGYDDLKYYLKLFGLLDPNKNWDVGGNGEYVPPSDIYLPTPIGLNYNITISPPDGGVITYKWTNKQRIKQLLSQVSLGFGVMGVDPVAGVSGIAGE